jgi:hypothetical protein
LRSFSSDNRSGVLALAAVRAVEVRIVDMRECCGLELGIFHVPTLPPTGRELLLYNSYSFSAKRALYNDMKADAAERLGAVMIIFVMRYTGRTQNEGVWLSKRRHLVPEGHVRGTGGMAS